MNSYEILELMWAGLIAINKQCEIDDGLSYGELDLEHAEADEWMHSIQHEGSYLTTMIDDDGWYQPCLRSY